MHAETDTTPATAHTLAAIDTGATAQANTQPEPSPEAVQAFTLASINFLEATASRYRAEEAEARAHAAAHRADPFLAPPERVMLATLADRRADNAAMRVAGVQVRIDALRATCPAANAAAPMAVIVLTVHRDRVQETARLVMGGSRSASRTWERTGAGTWRSSDRDWIEHEDRIGLELCEYMESLSFPNRIAAMLPRPPAAVASSAARQAAQEVRHA